MSYKILCASQKGGVGKSTLSQLIAIGYAKQDYKVLLADMDVQQKTTSEWFEDRILNDLSELITVKSFRNVSDVLKLADAEKFDLVVFDGAPHATAQTLDMSKRANLIILPHKEGKADMRPQVKLANELVKAGIQKENIVFVLNQTTTSENQIKLAFEYIGKTPYAILKTYIPQRPGILIGADNGLSILELPFASLREKGNNLFIDIATTLLKKYKNS